MSDLRAQNDGLELKTNSNISLFDIPRVERNGWRQRASQIPASKSLCELKKQDACLKGDRETLFSDCVEDKARLISFYLSSSITDTAVERYMILSDVMPYLVECATMRGFEIEIHEALYTVNKENELDQGLFDVSLNAIKQCQADSAGIFFILLSSDKYGYRRFPFKIPVAEFHDIKANLSDLDSTTLSSLYLLDTNADSPEYVLNSLGWHEMNANSPEALLKRLQTALRASASSVWPLAVADELREAESKHRIKSYNISITEEEVSHGLFWAPVDSISTGVHIFRRRFEMFDSFETVGLVDPRASGMAALGNFVDLADGAIDAEALRLLREQQHRMIPIALVAGKHVDTGLTQYPALPWAPAGVDPAHAAHRAYLTKLLDDVCATLLDSLDSACAALVEEDGVAEECARHIRIVRERAGAGLLEGTSVRRALDRIEQYLEGDEVGGMMLVVHGPPGSGKTSILARAFEAAGERAAAGAKDVALAVRFLGETAAAASARALVSSLCAQLCRLRPAGAASNPPHDLEGQRAWLRNALGDWDGGRLVLLLDGLDRLDDSDAGRALDWLPHAGLAPGVRVVVSTAPDSPFPAHGAPHFCLSILAARLAEAPAASGLVAIGPWEGPRVLLEHLLHRRGRRVTTSQADALLAAAAQSDQGRVPLYLALAAGWAARWDSATECPDRAKDGGLWLPPSVDGLCSRLLGRLIPLHGGGMVGAAAASIALARRGVTPSELRELLSLDDDALVDAGAARGPLAAVASSTAPCALVMAPAALGRLLADLVPLLACEGRAGVPLRWARAELAAAAAKLFFADAEARGARHALLADFFTGRWVGEPKPCSPRLRAELTAHRWAAAAAADRCVRRQPLAFGGSVWLPGARVNVRRCDEAAHHLLAARDWRAAARELCALDGVCARARCGEVHMAAAQMDRLLHMVDAAAMGDDDDGGDRRERGGAADAAGEAGRIRDYARWVRESAEDTSRDPLCAVTVSCSGQPLPSAARRDLMERVGELQAVAVVAGSWMLRLQLGVSAARFSPLVAELRGHAGRVRCAAWRMCGGRLASAGADGAVVVWDAAAGSRVAAVAAHAAGVECVAWSPEGQRLATGSHDGTARVWDANTGAAMGGFAGHAAWVSAVAWRPGGLYVCSGSGDKTAVVWDAATGAAVAELDHTAWVTAVAWCPDGVRLATAAADRTVRVWAVTAAAAALSVIGDFGGAVACVAWSPDGRRLAAAADDMAFAVRVWDAEATVGDSSGTMTLHGHEAPVNALAWDPRGGGRLASASADRTAAVWDTSSGSRVAVLRGHGLGVASAAWSPEGSRLVTGSGDGVTRVWDVALLLSDSQEGGGGVGEEAVVMGSGHVNQVECVAWSPDGAWLATASLDGTARVWAAGGSWDAAAALVGHMGAVTSVAWSGNSRCLATASADKTARVWELGRGALAAVGTIWGHTDAVAAVAWWRGGGLLATASEDRTARVWAAETGAQIAALRGHRAGVTAVAWRPDGAQLATADADGVVLVWAAAAWELMTETRPGSGSARALAWAPHGSRLTAVILDGGSGKGAAWIWDTAPTAKGQPQQLGPVCAATGVAWRPDSAQLAVCAADGALRVLDAGDLSEVVALRGGGAALTAVDWSPDGRRLVAAEGCGASVWLAVAVE